MTSRVHCFVWWLSKKKQTLTTEWLKPLVNYLVIRHSSSEKNNINLYWYAPELRVKYKLQTSKLRCESNWWIIRPGVVICQKLANSKTICVSTYDKSMVRYSPRGQASSQDSDSPKFGVIVLSNFGKLLGFYKIRIMNNFNYLYLSEALCVRNGLK